MTPVDPRAAGWLRGFLTDANGFWDVAFGGLFAVTVLVLGAILFVCAMSWADWVTCKPILSRDGAAVLQACRFDAGDVGGAVFKICTAYAAALTALAAYMAATRPPRNNQPGPSS